MYDDGMNVLVGTHNFFSLLASWRHIESCFVNIAVAFFILTGTDLKILITALPSDFDYTMGLVY